MGEGWLKAKRVNSQRDKETTEDGRWIVIFANRKLLLFVVFCKLIECRLFKSRMEKFVVENFLNYSFFEFYIYIYVFFLELHDGVSSLITYPIRRIYGI